MWLGFLVCATLSTLAAILRYERKYPLGGENVPLAVLNSRPPRVHSLHHMMQH